MKYLKSIFSLVILMIAYVHVGVAQSPFITADEYKTIVKENPNVVVLDANKSKAFKAAHLEGAIHIDHNDLYQDGDIKGLIKSPEELAEIFGSLGVSNDSKVILADDGSQKYTSRVYWILEYLGFDNAVILHKDKKKWRDARLSMTSKTVSPEPATFVANVNPTILATFDEVVAATEDPNTAIVDARTNDEYIGNHKNSTGHLPTAISLNYEDLLTETGEFKSKEELMAIAEANGLTPDKNIIAYCRTSVRATVHYVAFVKLLGYTNFKVYDGAYLEWVAKRDVVQ